MSTLRRLLLGGSRVEATHSARQLTKGTRVVAARDLVIVADDLGECEHDYVCAGTLGVVTAVSRIATYEVTFASGTRVTNLDSGDVRDVEEQVTAHAVHGRLG